MRNAHIADHHPRRAASIAATPIFRMPIMASKARLASAAPAATASLSTRGVIRRGTRQPILAQAKRTRDAEVKAAIRTPRAGRGVGGERRERISFERELYGRPLMAARRRCATCAAGIGLPQQCSMTP